MSYFDSIFTEALEEEVQRAIEHALKNYRFSHVCLQAKRSTLFKELTGITF